MRVKKDDPLQSLEPYWYGIREDLDLYWWDDEYGVDFWLIQGEDCVVLDENEARCLADLINKITKNHWKPIKTEC